MGTPLLSNDVILEIHQAALSARLEQSALLSGLDPALRSGLPELTSVAATMLSTLHELNSVRLLNDSVPLRTWLKTAAMLAGGRIEQRVFEQAIAALDQALVALQKAGAATHTTTTAAPQAASIAARKKLFVSYSHADAEWLNRLRVHLKPIDRAGRIDFWDDTRIPYGAKWRLEIKNALEGASLAVLLVSADFLASDFITSDELPKLLQAEASRGPRIIPIIVSPCLFSMTPILSDYQAANDPKRPLSALSKHEQDEVFLRVAQTLAAT